jgi:radical SAM family uncharacterized protein
MFLTQFRKPGRYTNHEVNSILKAAPLKVALCFPDIYEIGMSHLGLKILYKIINDLPYASAERVFSPWIDLEEYLKKENLPLCSIESNTPLNKFDVVGMSLQYELSYTTVLNMLSMGGIPIHSAERGNKDPIVIAGGPCTVNPYPVLPFFDAFFIGDAEDAMKDIMELCLNHKLDGGRDRAGLLGALSKIPGMFVPGYNQGATRRYITDLDTAPYPCSPVVPFVQAVHDRINIEISRGCTCGCRFCQAGMSYRPVRERKPETVLRLAEESIQNTGYDEVSFTSLSAGDYTHLLPLLKMFNARFKDQSISVSLPSLRVSALSEALIREIKAVKKSGFTIAPEAATPRLRSVINKDFGDEDYERSISLIFKEGWTGLKLYYMTGLPTECDEDVEAIPLMALRAQQSARKLTGRSANINVSVSAFVPKPHTPFQWHGQISLDEMERKRLYLKNRLTKKGLNFKWHDVRMSLLEAAFSRGGPDTARLIEAAWRRGARLDAWSELFNFDTWKAAMDETGLDASALAERSIDPGAPLFWDNIDTGVSSDYLRREYDNAVSGRIIPDCRTGCLGCGVRCESGEFLAAGDKNTDGAVYSRSAPAPRRFFSPIKVRMVFSKTLHVKYISHLELISALHKGLRRAGVPLSYSKGFHPTPGIAFGPPLSVGVAGLKEYLDMEVFPPFDAAKFKERINEKMPPGLSALDLFFLPKETMSLGKFLTAYSYEVDMPHPLIPSPSRPAASLVHGLVDMPHPLTPSPSGEGAGGEAGAGDEAGEGAGRDADRALIEENIKNTEWLSLNLVDFDIIDHKLFLFLRDTEQRKVKLFDILEAMLGRKIEPERVTRTALYGYRNGWVEPDAAGMATGGGSRTPASSGGSRTPASSGGATPASSWGATPASSGIRHGRQ